MATLPALTGDQVAAELSRLGADKRQVLIVANRFTGCVYARSMATEAWSPECRGELSDELLQATSQLRAQKAMWWSIVDGDPLVHDPATVETARATTPNLRRWLSQADDLTGREGEVSDGTRREVAALAAWRCQFAGCGVDLRTHAPTGRASRLSYYAHVVASSPNGPRGHATRSSLLADEPSNIMLLCDSCHRLIDRVDPGYYNEEMLQQMRQRSISEVRRLLDSLRYPDVEVLAIIGSIAGQVPQFSMRDAEAALWESHLRAARHEPEYLFHLGNQQHDVHAPDFWSAVFRAISSDMVVLQRLLNGTKRGGAPRPRLAVFPLHATSVLVLAGRILGENSGTHLFQPHRSAAAGAGATRWAWPARSSAPPPDKFKPVERRPLSEPITEAVLLVSLTFTISVERLPAACQVGGSLVLPTLEIVVNDADRGIHVISQPEDLQMLGRALDDAIQTLQDVWRVAKVHLFIGAPASATVLIGEKMQARHHATYVCHEARERDGPLLPTIEISGDVAREPISGLTCSLKV